VISTTWPRIALLPHTMERNLTGTGLWLFWATWERCRHFLQPGNQWLVSRARSIR
jgi:hypothetical protein